MLCHQSYHTSIRHRRVKVPENVGAGQHPRARYRRSGRNRYRLRFRDWGSHPRVCCSNTAPPPKAWAFGEPPGRPSFEPTECGIANLRIDRGLPACAVWPNPPLLSSPPPKNAAGCVGGLIRDRGRQVTGGRGPVWPARPARAFALETTMLSTRADGRLQPEWVSRCGLRVVCTCLPTSLPTCLPT